MKEYNFFLKGLSLIGFVNILIGLSYFILTPILSKNLSIVDFGLYNLVIVTLSLVSGISTLNLPLAIMRFVPSIKDRSEISESFYTLTFILFAFNSFICLIFILIAPSLSSILFDDNLNVVYLLVILIFINSLNIMLINYFRAVNSIVKYAFFLFCQSYLALLAISYFIYLGYGLIGTIFGLIIAQIVIFIFMIYFIYQNLGFKIPNFKNYRTYLSYSIPLIPSYVTYWIVECSDRYLIGIILGSIYVGYYAPAYIVGTILSLIIAPFPSVLLPLLSRHYDEGNLEKVGKYLDYSIKLFLSVGIPIFFGISILSYQILLIISNPEIAMNGYFVTPFIALGSLIFSIYIIIVLIISLEKKTKIISIIWSIVALFNLIGNIIFIPILGINGAALITLITYILALILVINFTKKFIKINWDLKFISKSLVSSLIISIFLFLLNPKGLFMLSVSILISISIYVIMMILLKSLKSDEIELIKGLIKGLKG